MTEDVTEQLNVDVSNKTDAVKDAQTHKRRAEKYEVLYAKDEKLQKFNDSYPKHKEEQVTQKKTLQRTIVMLLQHISKGLVNSSNLPDQAKFAEIKSELSFKESRVQHSKSTLGKLDAELQQKKAELNRINGLDKKISLELKAFKGKISDMKREAQTFKSTEDLHAEAKEVKSKLNAIKVEVSKKRDALKNQVQLLGHTLERKKRELNTNENAKRLDSLQTKLRAQTQNSFQLSEWIIARKREADWDSLRKQSVSLTSEINQAHIKCNRI
jgi:intraflagellar transport protein 74